MERVSKFLFLKISKSFYMFRIILLSVFTAIISLPSLAQQYEVTIEEEKTKSRVNFYAVNENLKDLDVVVTVTGIGFKQRGGAERPIRVPATSKVKVKSLIIERGKYPMYEYTVTTTDSLARRSLRPEFEKIKIDPPSPILLYSTAVCKRCDTLTKSLAASPYRFKTMHLPEKPDVAKVIERALPSLDTISSPIFSLGGALHTDILTYEQLIERLYEEKE